MCATAALASLFVLLVATLSVSIMCGNQMAAEGLPINRRVRGAEEYEDILAGNDFLSVLLESTMYRLKKEITTEQQFDLLEETETTEPYTRETREATNYFNQVPQTTERQPFSINTSDSSSSDGVIIATHVSSSVGSQINKDSRTVKETVSESTPAILDQHFLSSEDHPSIMVNSGNSELNVEEPAPITKTNEDSNNESAVDLNRLQASIHNLPTSHQITFNPSGFTKTPTSITTNNDESSSESTIDLTRLQASIQNFPSSQQITFNPIGFTSSPTKNNVPPFHHSLIYHDNPSQPGRARSVSYSTIIQEIQPSNEKSSEAHERKERNYETGTIFGNSYEDPNEKINKKVGSDSKNSYTSTSTPSTSTVSWQDNVASKGTSEKNWEKQFVQPTQRNSKVYGRPEQNYEVDEAVSVVTNGRTHGVVQLPQNSATQKPKSDQDKDQKVGYVVEGRNFRKYRVEERTSDGFIVGEYGVVSHDDGSLRGVRYTADGTINPRLIYDTLMKFLAL